MIRRRNKRDRPNQWPLTGNMLVIRPWPLDELITGKVVASGPHGVQLAGRDPIPWSKVWAFDEYSSADEYRDAAVEFSQTLIDDPCCEVVR